MIRYVDCNATHPGDGSKSRPFRTISQAAFVAQAGDQVLVAPGIYREEVSPRWAGTKDAPIVYRSAEPRAAVITGAEPVKNWVHFQEDVWMVTIPNAAFGNYNPYTTRVWGDWLDQIVPCHTGDVFLGEKSLYEQDSLEKVLHPVEDESSWDKEFTKHTWYTTQSEDGESTLIYANFQGKNPNLEDVEITYRPHCFYPEQEHVNYITLTGEGDVKNMEKLIDMLEDNDDVQNVWHNWDND